MKTHAEVLEGTQRLFLEALVAGDYNAIKSHMHTSFSYWNDSGELFTGVANIPIFNPEKRIANIQTLDTQIQLYDNVAVILSVEHHRGVYLDIIYDNHYRFTRVWKFIAGRWKIITATAAMV